MRFVGDDPPERNRGLYAIAVMAKASQPGRCKTRLAPPLTFEDAAALNTAFLHDIGANIAAAAAMAPIQGMAAYHPFGEEDFFDSVLPADFRLVPPREAGIGRSLVHATRDVLDAGYAGVCLVNSDSPTLPTSFLIDAVKLLTLPGDRVVLGPAADGGYYLIGMKRLHSRIYEEIDWSTERVFGQTLERAAQIGLEVATLPPWYDVDDRETLEYLTRELFGLDGEGPYRGGNSAPSTSAALGPLLKTSLTARRQIASLPR